MKKMFIVVLLAVCAAGCSKAPHERVIARINNYSISPQEFEIEFRESAYGSTDTPEARAQFLETLINRKLIMQDAQKLGLDKDVEFLKSIERYWEQLLLKASLDRKGSEIAGSVRISDSAVEAQYKKLVAEGKADMPYEQMYRDLKWQLTHDKEEKLMQEWVDSLRRQAVIKEDLNALKAK